MTPNGHRKQEKQGRKYNGTYRCANVPTEGKFPWWWVCVGHDDVQAAAQWAPRLCINRQASEGHGHSVHRQRSWEKDFFPLLEDKFWKAQRKAFWVQKHFCLWLRKYCIDGPKWHKLDFTGLIKYKTKIIAIYWRPKNTPRWFWATQTCMVIFILQCWRGWDLCSSGWVQ